MTATISPTDGMTDDDGGMLIPKEISDILWWSFFQEPRLLKAYFQDLLDYGEYEIEYINSHMEISRVTVLEW